MPEPPSQVDLLILGAGWTSTFLIPLCASRKISCAATSRPSAPKPDTIPFEFDPNSHDSKGFDALPDAHTVLITFPIKVKGASRRLVKHYEQTHPNATAAYIQLGSTGIWDNAPGLWKDKHSPIINPDERAMAEDELLSLAPRHRRTTVLNLSGLWGGERSVKHWVGRVAPTKEALKKKGSIHMIHGEDVSRAILAVHQNFDRAVGERWLLTDGRVYDWWNIASAWGDVESKWRPEVGVRTEEAGENGTSRGKGPQLKWVRELMQEEGVRALPRTPEQLGRALDSREFWNTFELEPIKARLE